MVIFPMWFFTWPVLLIAIGLFSGIRHGFRGPFWIIMILIGGFFLAGKIDRDLGIEKFIWPVVFIVIGLVFILRPKRNFRNKWKQHFKNNEADDNTETSPTEMIYDSTTADRKDFVEVTAVFGGIKKNVLSKNFKGGDIVSFMGGSEIDLTQADFSGFALNCAREYADVPPCGHRLWRFRCSACPC